MPAAQKWGSMQDYFLISEFAKLRNVNINSLRYYEKLGLLRPAYIDKKTNYRYYLPEQVTVLNKIILCIQLGIPLKEMVNMIDEDGNLQSQKLLEQGKLLAQQRIEEMQNNLNYIEMSLKSIEGNKKFAGKQSVYPRYFHERTVIVTGYIHRQPLIRKRMVSEVAELYKDAQKNDFFPLLPAGQLIDIDPSGEMRYRCFLEILNGKKGHPQLVTLPAGEYSCVQANLTMNTDLPEIIRENWPEHESSAVIVDNVMSEKYSFKTRPSELQRIRLTENRARTL